MRALSSEQILRIWERGATEPAVVRPLVILGEADPEADAGLLARLPLGVRDRRLLDLRARTFGPDLAACVTCPSCADAIEFAFSADTRGPDSIALEPMPHAATLGELRVEVRCINTADLMAATAATSADQARRLLAARCVTRFSADASDSAGLEFPDDLLPVVADLLQAADPHAESRVDVRCPSCAATSEHVVDVATFFWTEIEAEALRLLRDVHALARGYGWDETDILSMTPIRRQAYLELLG